MSEIQVRRMRAMVYGECTDNNWFACRENWMRPDSIEWLIVVSQRKLHYADH